MGDYWVNDGQGHVGWAGPTTDTPDPGPQGAQPTTGAPPAPSAGTNPATGTPYPQTAPGTVAANGTTMSSGAAPWATALAGGYPQAAFTNPDQGAGTVPTQQQWYRMSPSEQAAVASTNWSTTGMTGADLGNYLQQSGPQWNAPYAATYGSY